MTVSTVGHRERTAQCRRHGSTRCLPCSGATESLSGGWRAVWRCGTVLGIVTFLSSCTHYQPAPLEQHQAVEQFAARQLGDARVHEALQHLLPQPSAWPPPEWDRAQLLAVALVSNPELAVARAQAQAVLSREVSAAQYPNPDLTLQSEYARHDRYAWLYGVGVEWLMPWSERRRLEIQATRLDTTNARAQLMDATWAVRRALAGALSDWESARRGLALLERLAILQDNLLALEQRRIRGGEDPPSELVVSERERIGIEQQQVQQHIAAETAQAAAAKALGLPPQALDGVALAWPDWGDPPPLDEAQLGAAREQALLSRADLRIAIGEYAVAETRLHLAVVRQYPELDLQPGFYWDHGIAKFPFDVTFEVPFNGNRGEIAEARAGRELAGQHMLAVQIGIYTEIASAERAERIVRASEAVARRQLESAQEQEQQVETAFRLGAMDSLEMTGAQIFSLRAELELVGVRAQLQAARNTLEDVLHAPLSGPELSLTKAIPAAVGAEGP